MDSMKILFKKHCPSNKDCPYRVCNCVFENVYLKCVVSLKMIKLNKTTHLMILFTFAIIFVVFYLYYTINDVRQLKAENKKLSADVSKTSQDIQNVASTLTKEIMEIKSILKSCGGGSVCVVPSTQAPQVLPQQAPTTLQPTIPSSTAQILNEIDEDDSSSVDTDAIKQMLVDHEEEDEDTIEKQEDTHPSPVDSPEPESAIELPQDSAEVKQQEDVTKMKYDDLRELCKSRGLSSKGTKDQLITRLQNA